MFCPSCGAPVSTKFCTNCGAGQRSNEPLSRSEPRRERSGKKRGTVIAAVAVAVLALAGFGGKYAWDLTAVKRQCALQAGDVDALVPWSVHSVTVHSGTEQRPFVECRYASGQSGPYPDAVSLFQDATEAGETPGTEQCLEGGYWQGRGYACVRFYTGGNGASGPSKRSVLAEGVRLNGPKTYHGQVSCMEESPADSPSRQLQERCFDELDKLMTAAAAKLEIAPDANATQDDLSLDAVLAQAGLAGAPASPGQEDTPAQEAVDLSGSASFRHFDVSVTGAEPGDDDTTVVHASVCLTSLTDDASNGTTRISWDPWSAMTAAGKTIKPVTGKGVTDTFPRESRAAPGDCVTGDLVFKAKDLASVTYQNGQGDSATFP